MKLGILFVKTITQNHDDLSWSCEIGTMDDELVWIQCTERDMLDVIIL
jgi:hypothetical protein